MKLFSKKFPVLVLGTIMKDRSSFLFMDPWIQLSYPYGLHPLLLTMRLRGPTSIRRPKTLNISKGVRNVACVTAPTSIAPEY